MNTAVILFNQVLIMFILAGIGYLMFRFGKISQEGSKSIGNILIYLSLPCVIIKGFLLNRTPELMQQLLFSSIAAAVILLICIIISNLFFKKDAIAVFGSSFSNPGFFGIPLITASLGSSSVFFIAAFIAFLNLLQWTYGVSIMTNDKSGFKPSKLLKAPFFIAILIGLFFFLSGITMPVLALKTIDFLAAVNTPLAMFTIGIYMAQTDVLKMLVKPKLYFISIVRLLIIPLIVLAGLYFVPGNMNSMKLALLIAAACPVGSNIAVYAQLHNNNYQYAVESVVISTLLSLITLPLIVTLAGLIGIAV